MMQKKGDISMNYIIVAAIALVALVVITLFFTGGLQTLFQQQKETVEGATDQQKEIWRGQCKLYCSLGQRENFVKKVFEGPDDTDFTCNSLKVECGDCTGKAAEGKKPCSQRTETECTGEGCTWEQWK